MNFDDLILTKSENNIKEEAIPLISFNQIQRKFEINENASKILKSIKGPIGVVSVAGMYRTGKSFLLNRMLLGRQDGFSVGPSINPCTKGLWIWTKPIQGYSPDGNPINVLIIDTEGIGATDEDHNHDSKIFTLAILLSSYFIYNSQGSIDENAIQNLSLIVNLTKNIQLKNQEKETNIEELSNYFPSFMWVIRDFSLKLINEDGFPINSREYLEKSLEPQKGNFYSDSIEQKNKIRHLIRNFFKERDCVTMIRPLTDEESLQNLANLDISKLRNEFIEQINTVRKKVLHRVKPKSLNGCPLNGEMFVNLMTSYIDSINNGAVPVIENAWSFLCKNETEKAFQSALSSFEENVNLNIVSKFPLDEENLNELFKEVKRNTFKIYQNEALGSVSKKFEDELKRKMKEKFSSLLIENEKESKNLCFVFLKKNFLEIEKNLKNYKTFEEFENDLNDFEEFYINNAPKGPKREFYLYEFINKELLRFSNQFIKSQNSEFDSFKLEKEQKMNKIEEKYSNELKNLKNDLETKEKTIKSLQDELKEIKTNNEDISKSVQLTKKDKEETEKNLKEQFKKIESNYQNQIIELKQNIQNLEDSKRIFLNQTKINETEFEKQKSLLQHQIKLFEKNIDELKSKETNYVNEIKNLKLVTTNKQKDLLEKYENQIKQLNSKYSVLHEKNIELETKLIEKEKRLEHEENQNKEIIERLEEQIEDLTRQLRNNEEEFKYNETSMKEDFEQTIIELNEKNSKIQQKFDETFQKLTDLEFENIQIKHNFDSENNKLSQNLKFCEMKINELETKLEKDKESYEALIKVLEERHESALNDNEQHFKNFEDIKQLYTRELNNLKEEYFTTKDKLTKDLEISLTNFNELEMKYKLETDSLVLQNKQLNDKINEISVDSKKFEENNKKLEKEKENLIDDFKLKIHQIKAENDQIILKLKKDFHSEMEEEHLKMEKEIKEIRNLYELKERGLEEKLNIEKKKFNEKLKENEDFYEEKIEMLMKEKNEKIDELEDEIDDLQNNQRDYSLQMDHEISLLNQQIETLTNLLNEKKESLNSLTFSQKQSLEQILNNFNLEKEGLLNKIDQLNNDLNLKERDISLLNYQKEQFELNLKEKQKNFEDFIEKNQKEVNDFNKQINDLKNDLNLLQNDYNELRSKLLKDEALNQQAIEFKNEKINELTEQINELMFRNEEKLNQIKENIDKEYRDKIDGLTNEKAELEKKLIQKKKELKDKENSYLKIKTLLEKEKSVLNEKLINITKSREELMETFEQEKKNFNLKFKELNEQIKLSGSETIEENKNLRQKISVLEKDIIELSNKVEMEKQLNQSKQSYLDQIKTKTKTELIESQKKFEKLLENIQKQNNIEKENYKNNMNSYISSLEERNKNLLNETKESFQKSLNEQLNKRKELENEIRSLYIKLQEEQATKFVNNGELEKKLQKCLDNEEKLKKELDEAINSKEIKIKEISFAFEQEKEKFKQIVKELENKLKENENRRNNLLIDTEKEKALSNKDKETMHNQVEKLNDKLFAVEKNFEKTIKQKEEFLRENERLKREVKTNRSHTPSYIPRNGRFGTAVKDSCQKTNSNCSFVKNFDNIDLLSLNNNLRETKFTKMDNDGDFDGNSSMIENNENVNISNLV